MKDKLSLSTIGGGGGVKHTQASYHALASVFTNHRSCHNRWLVRDTLSGASEVVVRGKTVLIEKRCSLDRQYLVIRNGNN